MIPRQFKLVNKTWVVRLVSTKQLQNHLDAHWGDDTAPDEASDMYGLCDQGASRIFLNKDKHRNQQELEHTFYHELVHCILFANGDVGHDEVFVERIGGFVHQIVDTMEYGNVEIKERPSKAADNKERGSKD